MSSRVRRLSLAGLGLGLGLVAIELALQVVALVIWILAPEGRTSPGADGQRVVLCIGDSNTYGVGASGHDGEVGPYPARLERAMNADAPDREWRVVNAGWPGRNSREVLLDLPRQLEAHRPEFVYVLVGTNDRWSLPRRVKPGDVAPEGFQVRWRTRRLAMLMIDWMFAEPKPAVPPFVGKWHDAKLGTELILEAGGRVLAAQHELWWRMEGEMLVIVPPQGEPTQHTWRIDGGNLVLVRDGTESVFRPGPPPEAAAHANLFFQPAPVAVEPKDFDAAFEEACRDLEADTGSPLGWSKLAALELGEQQWGRIEKILRAAIDRSTVPAKKARLLRGLCGFCHHDPDQRLRLAIEATRLDGLRGPLLELVKHHEPPLLRDQFDAAVMESTEPGAEREELLVLFDVVSDRPDAYIDTYEAHLRQIVEVCRRAGATPVLLDYPQGLEPITAAVRRLEADLDVGYVPISAEFKQALRTRRQEDLFIPDGHCNDSGYAILTSAVAADLSWRVRNQ